jgi:hypothetical protein
VVAKLNICVHHLKNQLAFGILGRSTVAKLLKVWLKLKWDLCKEEKQEISAADFFAQIVSSKRPIFASAILSSAIKLEKNSLSSKSTSNLSCNEDISQKFSKSEDRNAKIF